MTYSSDALAGALGLPASPTGLRVPHPRPLSPTQPERAASDRGAADQIHLGFLGTPRLHKGLATIRALVHAEPRFVLHLFAGDSEDGFAATDPQVIRHPGTTPLAELYAGLDAVLLPQGDGRGARLQLPAKLLDAMRAGVPTLATPTPPIREIGGPTFAPVADWNDQTAVAKAVGQTVDSDLGRAARRRFEESFAAEVQVAGFDGFVDRVVGG